MPIPQLDELRHNADALSALKLMLEEMLGQSADVNVSGSPPNHMLTMGFRGYSLYVELSRNGMQLYGNWTREQRKTIEEFIQTLLLALAEQQLIDAIASQFELTSDAPLLDQLNMPIGRMIEVNV